MPDHTYHFKIEVDGTALPEDVATLLTSAVVDDSQNVPDLFVFTFRDPDRTVLAKAGFKVGSKVKVSVIAAEHAGGEHLITGEVTALEAEYDAGGTTTVVRGLDHSHRLFRGLTNYTYTNVTASDVARTVAQRAGVPVGTIDPTTQVHEYLCQASETDWAFLRRLAADSNMTIGVVEGKLHFKDLGQAAAAPQAGALQAAAADPFQLIVGENVTHLRCSVTSAEQVKEVQVRSFDPKQEKVLVGTASGTTTSAQNGASPASMAATFGNATYVVADRPVRTQAGVDLLAKATAEQFAGASTEITGTATGNARLSAGSAVSLGLAGAPFDGRYVLTSTRHRWDSDTGYTTEFTVSGKQERSLLGLAASGGSGSDSGAQGLAFAVVTDVQDPDKIGRVKVKFPQLADNFDSFWAPVVYPGAGDKRGLMLIPEVSDVVVVGFEHGDVARPFVLGAVYSPKSTPPLTATHIDQGSGEVNSRVLVSRKGHRLVFEDKAGAESLGLFSTDEKLLVKIDVTNKTVKVVSDQDVVVEAGKDVKVTAKANVSIEAGAGMKLKATGTLDLEGAQVNVKGSGPVAVKGNPIQLN